MSQVDTRPVSRALISVSDKTGLVEFARALAGLRRRSLVSTGGTAKALAAAGLTVTDVAAVTGFPEMMDGRVKTLHPKRAWRPARACATTPSTPRRMKEHGIGGIDLVVVNLYPFEEPTVASAGPTRLHREHRHRRAGDDPLGGQEPRLCRGVRRRRRLRAGAGRADATGGATLSTLRAGWRPRPTPAPPPMTRRSRPGSPSQHRRTTSPPRRVALPARWSRACATARTRTSGRPSTDRRAARTGVATARQLQGKELSYNNINDTDAAFERRRVRPERPPACAIIKHANPCGVATRLQTCRRPMRTPCACDPVSAFGGIVALQPHAGRRHGERSPRSSPR